MIRLVSLSLFKSLLVHSKLQGEIPDTCFRAGQTLRAHYGNLRAFETRRNSAGPLVRAAYEKQFVSRQKWNGFPFQVGQLRAKSVNGSLWQKPPTNVFIVNGPATFGLLSAALDRRITNFELA